MSLSPSQGAESRSIAQRGRNRVCKHCKFSCTDAQTFYKHQVTAHGSDQQHTADANVTSGDSNKALVHSKATTQGSFGVHSEEADLSDRECDSAQSVEGLKENVMSSVKMQLTTAHTDAVDTANNNHELRNKHEFFENNPDYPGEKPSEDASTENNLSSASQRRQSVVSNGSGLDDNELYGDREPMDTSDQNLVIDEEQESLASSLKKITSPATSQNVFQTPYINITPEGDSFNADSSREYTASSPVSASSYLKHDAYPKAAANQSPVFPSGLLTLQKTPTKGKAAAANNLTPGKRCAPVREAVDPAKYITVQEGDGVKYACSKCGNIYKWRKSLNKHWKEKHDGEIPVPRSNTGNIALPRMSNSLLSMTPSRSNTARLSTTSKTQQEAPYLTSLARNQASSYLSSTPLSKYDDKSPERFLSGMRSRGYKSQNTSPKQSNFPFSNYRSSSGRKSTSMLTSPDVLRYLNSQQKLVSSWLPSSEKEQRSLLSPPSSSHDYSKSTRGYSAQKSPLSRSFDMGQIDYTKQTLNTSQNSEQEGVLDLSIKGAASISSMRRSQIDVPQIQAPSTESNEPVQDEPLDFSKSTGSHATKRAQDTTGSSSASVVKSYESAFQSYSKVTASASSAAMGGSEERLKRCVLCSYVTHDERALETHVSLHKTQDICCYECKETFRSSEDLNQHFVLCHMKVLAKRMAQVRSEKAQADAKAAENEAGGNNDQLYQYLKSANKATSACIVCGMPYQFQWALARHFEQEHSSLPNPYHIPDTPSPEMSSSPVPILQAQISSLTKVNSPTTHEDASEVLKCVQCSFVAGSSSELAQHQMSHSQKRPAANSVICTECGYVEREGTDLANHYAQDHPELPLPADMSAGVVGTQEGDDDDAGSRSSTGLGLLTPDGKSLMDFQDAEHPHTAIVFPQAPEETGKNGVKGAASVHAMLPYKCSVCDYRARWPSEITQHMKNHSDEKPFRCPRCTYKSKWKWDVVKHLKRCGGGTVKDVIEDSKDFNSSIESWSGENLSLSHARELSKGPPNATVHPSDRFSPSRFGGQHLDVYTNENSTESFGNSLCASPVSNTSISCAEDHAASDMQQAYCPQCPFVGTSRGELKRHMKVHSDEKPFTCKTCGYSSKWKCDLKKHIRIYNHESAVSLSYGGHGRKPKAEVEEGRDGSGSEQGLSDDHGAAMSEEPLSQDESDGTDAETGSMQHYTGALRCEKCPFATDTQAKLLVHEQMHNSDDGVPPYKCTLCEFITDDWQSFQQHKKLLHPGFYGNQLSEAGSVGDIDTIEGSAANRRKQSKTSIVKTKYETAHPLENSAFLAADLSTQSAAAAAPAAKRTKTPTNTLSCGHCPFTTNNYQNYERHLASHKTAELSYQCEWCQWGSPQIDALYRHVQGTHPYKINEWFSKEAFLDRAKERAIAALDKSPYSVSPSGSPVHSPLFGKPVYSEGKKTKRRLKTCGKCGYITDNVTTLQRHMTKHGKQGKYTCTHCDYSVDKQHVLDYHIRLVHQAKQDSSSPVDSPLNLAPSPVEADNTSNSTVEFNEYESQELDTVTSESDALIDFDNADISSLRGEDVKIVHLANRTVYGCTKCSYNTMKVGSVLSHTRQHGAAKRFTCLSCDYSADHVTHVTGHMRAIHGDNREPLAANGNVNKSSFHDRNNETEDEPASKRQRTEEGEENVAPSR